MRAACACSLSHPLRSARNTQKNIFVLKNDLFPSCAPPPPPCPYRAYFSWCETNVSGMCVPIVAQLFSQFSKPPLAPLPTR